MKRKSAIILLILMIMVLLLAKSPIMAAEHRSQVAVPETITLMTYDIGATSYVMYGYVGDALLRKFGTKLRAIPCGNDIARMIPLRAGETEFAGQGGDIYFAEEGLDRYNTRVWGPQPLRMVWLAMHPGVTAVVRGTSDIKKLADLKAKKVAWIPGSVMNKMVEGHLAFAGLTWDDVEKVQVSGFGASLRAIIDGKVDMACAANTSTTNYELASSPYGIRFLSMPASDKKGWVKAKKVMPFWVPFKAMLGPGLSEENPNPCAGFSFPATICYPRLNEDTAYFMTKAIHEGYDIMARASKIMKAYWTLEHCLNLFENSDMYIFHLGSVRYFKNIGVWKSGWDEKQRERIAYQNKLKTLWKKALADADKKGIKDKKFPEYWLKLRTESLKD